MIPKSQMYLGARIVENDPEEETPVVPYKGTVTAIEETGKGELDYFVYIRLDDESMKQRTPYYAGGRRRYCVQSAGKHAGDGKENRQDDLQGSCPFQQYQHRNHER